MPNQIQTGLDKLLNDPVLLNKLGDRVAYLGHEASVSKQLRPGYLEIHAKIGKRLVCLFGPQHGFSTLDQDNMIETDHQIHPNLGIPIYSLYSETRKPTEAMLAGLDTLVIDLQDIGTRVYTYIWTVFLIMEACRKKSLKILVLDRPNPIGGERTEGNLPKSEWFSFVCLSEIPMRHGLTVGELAQLFNQEFNQEVNLEIIPMSGWERWMYWNDTGLPWVNPSPNLPTPSGSIIYPGSVMIEGTNMSEGRGTTRSLEVFGHPKLDPIQTLSLLEAELESLDLKGIYLRPTFFKPTFDKFIGQVCGGFQIHCHDKSIFSPWASMQQIIRILYRELELDNFWNEEAYEYETKGLAIDYINVNSEIRKWIEGNGSMHDLMDLENEGFSNYASKIASIKLY